MAQKILLFGKVIGSGDHPVVLVVLVHDAEITDLPVRHDVPHLLLPDVEIISAVADNPAEILAVKSAKCYHRSVWPGRESRMSALHGLLVSVHYHGAPGDIAYIHPVQPD